MKIEPKIEFVVKQRREHDARCGRQEDEKIKKSKEWQQQQRRRRWQWQQQPTRSWLCSARSRFIETLQFLYTTIFFSSSILHCALCNTYFLFFCFFRNEIASDRFWFGYGFKLYHHKWKMTNRCEYCVRGYRGHCKFVCNAPCRVWHTLALSLSPFFSLSVWSP